MKDQTTQVSRLVEIVEILKHKKGLKQSEIAEQAGLNASNLSHYTTRRTRNLNRKTLAGFEKAFNVSEHYIRTGEGEPFIGGEIKALEPRKSENEGGSHNSHLKWLEGWIDRLNDEIAALRAELDARPTKPMDPELWNALMGLPDWSRDAHRGSILKDYAEHIREDDDEEHQKHG